MFGFLNLNRPRFTLIIGDDGVMLVPVRVTGMGEAVFAGARDAAGRQAVQAILAQQPQVPLTILANVTAQDARVEDLPPLNVLDRGKLARRRLRQAFADSYAAGCRLTGRRSAVLAALHQGGAVAGWLEPRAPLTTNLGLLPLESATMVTRLMPEARHGWAVLLARFATGGLRQIVTQDGRFVFSRPTPVPVHDDPRHQAAIIADTIKASLGYLSRFGLNDSAALRIGVIMDAATLAALRDKLTGSAPLLLTPQQAAVALGQNDVGEDTDGTSDILFATYVAGQGIVLPLLPPALHQRRRTAWMAYGGMRVAAGLMVIALALTGWDGSRLGYQLYANARDARAVATMKQTFLAEQQATAPDAKPLARLRAALERQRLFTETPVLPWAMVTQLATGLGDAARLVKYDWHADDSAKITLRLTDHAPDVKDRDAMLDAFKKVTNAIADALPDYVVEVTRYPFPALPQETLTNAGGEATAAPDTATADLVIRRKAP